MCATDISKKSSTCKIRPSEVAAILRLVWYHPRTIDFETKRKPMKQQQQRRDSCLARPLFISYRPLIYAKTTVSMTPRIKLDHRATSERCCGSSHDGAMLPNLEGKPQLRTPYFYVRIQWRPERFELKEFILVRALVLTRPPPSGEDLRVRILGRVLPPPGGGELRVPAEGRDPELPAPGRGQCPP